MAPEQPEVRNYQVEKDQKSQKVPAVVSSERKDTLPSFNEKDSDAEVKAKYDQITGDGKFDSIDEYLLAQKLIRQSDSIRFEKELRSNPNVPAQAKTEYIVSHEALTYYEYLANILHSVRDTMTTYEKERAKESVLPADIIDKEMQAKLYIEHLQKALDERKEFASARLSDAMIRSAQGNAIQLRKNIQDFSTVLDPESLRAFRLGGEAALVHGNKLDQQIIDILAGKGEIPGVEKGFMPAHLYFDFLKYRFDSLLKKQVADARSGDAPKWSKDSPEGKERDRLTAELVRTTQEMGKTDIQLAELATVSNLLGKQFNLTDALSPRTVQTSEEIRKAVHEAMKQRSDYHLGQMEKFSHVVDTVVLSEGVILNLDDFWTKNGRNGVKFISEKIAGAVTMVVPKTAGMRQWAYDELTDPISDAMGWPKGKEKWEELTPDEQQKVREKSKSILDSVRSFDRTTISHFTGTISMIRSMPDPATLLDQAKNVPTELPTEEVRTPQQLAEARKKYGDATAYCMLFKQLEVDWGDSKEGTGFMGQYAHFFDSLEKVIGVKLDVARGDLDVASKWGGISISFGILALLGLVAGAIVAKKLLEGTAKLTSKVVKETAKAGAKGTRAGLDALRKTVSKSPKAPPSGAAGAVETGADVETIIAETAPKATGKVAKGLRILGTAGFVFAVGMTGKEIYERIDEQAHLAPIKDEQERIKAALAFFESDEAKRTFGESTPAYNRSINILSDRLQSIVALREAAKILPEVPTTGLDNAQKSTLIRLQTRTWALQKKLQENAKKVHDYSAKQMPIDSLINKDTRSGSYKVDVGGGIGIFSGAKLQDAMQKSDSRLSSGMSMSYELEVCMLAKQLEDQTQEFSKTLKEYLDILASATPQ